MRIVRYVLYIGQKFRTQSAIRSATRYSMALTVALAAQTQRAMAGAPRGAARTAWTKVFMARPAQSHNLIATVKACGCVDWQYMQRDGALSAQ